MHSEIEHAQENVEALRERLRSEVTAEVQANMRRKGWRRFAFRFGGCCGIYLVGLIAIPAVALYLIARTGLVSVPVFSARVDHARDPVRVVMAIGDADIATLVQREVQRAIRQSGPSADRLTLSFSEGALTGAIRASLTASSGFSPLVRQHVQVAIDRDRVELFTRTAGIGAAETTVRIVGTPSWGDNRLVVRVHEVTIGSLGVPRFIAQRIADSLIARAEPGALPSSLPPLTVDRIDLGDGVLAVTVRMRRP